MNNSKEHKNDGQGQDKEIIIIVNGREKIVTDKKITFSQVVELAFGVSANNNTVYTVTYSKGHGNKPDGIMVDGDIVKVKERMIFNVTATDKS